MKFIPSATVASKTTNVAMTLLLLSAMLQVSASQAAEPAANKHAAGVCHSVRLPVALGSGLPANQTISATLCVPHAHHARVIDVLVHGATYNHTYWDFPVDYPAYSHVRRTLEAGRATFNYDRLGVGLSSRPSSNDVTMDADAHVLHQVVQWLRHRYREINVIGHSFGSAVAIMEAAQYNDADRLVVTDLLHASGPALVNGELQVYPAEQDPQFAGKGYDPGYATSVPGTRGPVFYDTGAADPAVIAYDESHKDVTSSTQRAQGQAQRTMPVASNLTQQVRVPVLIIAGQRDRLYCGLALDCTDTGAVRAFETPYYGHARRVTVATEPDTGHDLALHPSAAKSFQKIDEWLRTSP